MAIEPKGVGARAGGQQGVLWLLPVHGGATGPAGGGNAADAGIGSSGDGADAGSEVVGREDEVSQLDGWAEPPSDLVAQYVAVLLEGVGKHEEPSKTANYANVGGACACACLVWLSDVDVALVACC